MVFVRTGQKYSYSIFMQIGKYTCHVQKNLSNYDVIDVLNIDMQAVFPTGFILAAGGLSLLHVFKK